ANDGVHHAAGEPAFGDQVRDRARAPDLVDGAQMMAVSALDGFAALAVNAERSSVELLLEIVDRERVAGEQTMNESALDQPANRGAAAGVDHHRPRGRDAAARAAFHRAGDALDRVPHHALRGDVARHEAELAAIALDEVGLDANAFESDHHRVAATQLAQLDA